MSESFVGSIQGVREYDNPSQEVQESAVNVSVHSEPDEDQKSIHDFVGTKKSTRV